MKTWKTTYFILLIAILSITTDAQNNLDSKERKALEILTLAKKSIYSKGFDTSKIKSISIETQGTLVADSNVTIEGEQTPRNTKSRVEVEESFFIDLLEKIRHIVVTRETEKNPIENFTKVVMVSNRDKIFFDTQKVTDGKLFDLNEILNSSDVPETTKKQIRMQQENARKTVTRERIIKDSVNKILPILLYNPWAKEKFSYIGKAVAGETKADVLQLESSTGRQIQYFFDEKSHLLLMITDKIERSDASVNASYFFGDYKKINGILVANKINIEILTIVKQKVGDKNITSTSKIISELKTKEFKINASFSDNIFTVK